MQPASQQPDSGPRFLFIFPSIMLPMFLAIVDQMMVATALPAIGGEFGNLEQTSWLIAGYLVAAAVAAPVHGCLGDAFGRRRMMLVSLAIAAAGSALCAFAGNMEALIASRILQGLGGGGLMALAHALIGQSVAPSERARYQGVLASVGVAAATLGPVLGGFITYYLGWRAVFLVNLPVVAMSAVLLLRLPERRGPARPFAFDWLGTVLLAAVVSTLLLGLDAAGEGGGAPLLVAIAFGLAASISLILLVVQQRRSPSPLIPFAIFKNPSILRSNLLAAAHGALLVSLVTYMPTYLTLARGIPLTEIGVLMVPMTLGVAVGSTLTGIFVSRWKRTTIMPIIGLACGAATLLLLSVLLDGLSDLWLAVLLGAVTVFLGTTMAVVQLTVLAEADPAMLGSATAFTQLCRSLGAAVGTAVAGLLIFAMLERGLPGGSIAALRDILPGAAGAELRSAAVAAFATFFRAAAMLTLISCAIAAWIPRRTL